jgi:glycosyltransferase involved in cell wall biosynthesis
MSHVVVIADTRYPIAEPFAGGMQSMTWHLVHGLRRRGLQVSVFAGPGTDPRLGAMTLEVEPLRLSDAARRDVSMLPEEWVRQHHAYMRVMLDLSRRDDVDLVHNNSLHHMPVAMADLIPVPVVTTLHTPPTPWLEPAVRHGGPEHNRFVAVSEHTAALWSHAAEVDVIPNGVDTEQWPLGPGGGDLVWFGRIVPEKAPHLAIEIARRAGRHLRFAGPRPDPIYWAEKIRPRLGAGVEYVGHLTQQDLAQLVGSSAACLVTPRWDEPFGLVGAESLSCGTPVVGFARGGLPEVVDRSCARLVDGDDVDGAVLAVEEAVRLPRAAARERALRHCSVDQMIDRYLELFLELAPAA